MFFVGKQRSLKSFKSLKSFFFFFEKSQFRQQAELDFPLPPSIDPLIKKIIFCFIFFNGRSNKTFYGRN
jgi:hypothetical protein